MYMHYTCIYTQIAWPGQHHNWKIDDVYQPSQVYIVPVVIQVLVAQNSTT